ncbi:MAG: NACHT domain-containing protein, partial [Bacteroidota bacterium]
MIQLLNEHPEIKVAHLIFIINFPKAMIVYDVMYFEPFKDLLVRVVKKSSLLKKFENFQQGDFKKLSKEIEECLGKDKPIKPSTLRDYKARYLEKEPFTANTNQLDYLSEYIKYESWDDFLDKAQGITQNKTEIEEWNFMRDFVVAHYTSSSFVNVPLGGLGGLPSTNSFKLSQLYIDLSYVDQKIFRDSTNLSIKEKEQYRKVHRESIFRMSERLSEPIIEGNERVLLLGNPGAGKSVFSKFLCWNWAQNHTKKNTIYLHITLRELNYKSSESLIISYLQNHYFKSQGIDYIGQLISKNIENVIFVLDGYDELSHQKKENLFESLEAINANYRFILLSRPYGLIDRSVYADTTLEIIGFNDHNRFQFISRALSKIKEISISQSDLMIILHKNEVLNEMSFTPLMLSYIMLICTQKEAPILLKSISSTFELYQAFLHFQKLRGLTKGIAENEFIDKLKTGIELAFDMEMNQQYLFESTDLLDPKKEKCIALSEIGIGRLQDDSNELFWTFCFTSSPFQEYLASRYFTSNAREVILVLLKNHFYWNLCKMIIGAFDVQSKKDELRDVFNGLKAQYLDTKDETYEYQFWILLAECSEPLINEILDKEDIARLSRVLFVSLESQWWGSLVFQATRQLLPKLDMGKEMSLYHLISKTFMSKEDIYNHLRASKLSGELQLQKNSGFLAVLVLVVQQLIKQYESIQGNSTDPYYIQERIPLKAAIKSGLNVIVRADTKDLAQVGKELTKLVSLIPAEYGKELETLQYKLADKLVDLLEALKTALANPMELSVEHFRKDIQPILIQMLISFEQGVNDHEITNLISHSSDWYASYIPKNPSEEDLKLIKLLLKQKDLLTKKTQKALLASVGDHFDTIREANVDLEVLVEVLDQAITKIEAKGPSFKTLFKITSLLMIESVGFRAYPIFSGRLFNITIKLIKANTELLETCLSHYLKGEFEELDYIEEFKWIEQVLTLPEFNYEKKKLIEQFYAHRYVNEHFIKKHCLPQILAHDSAFYDSQTWETVRYLITDDIDSIVDAFNTLANEDLYYFKDNLVQIRDTLKLVNKYVSKEKILSNKYASSQIFLLNRIVFYTIRLMNE